MIAEVLYFRKGIGELFQEEAPFQDPGFVGESALDAVGGFGIVIGVDDESSTACFEQKFFIFFYGMGIEFFADAPVGALESEQAIDLLLDGEAIFRSALCIVVEFAENGLHDRTGQGVVGGSLFFKIVFRAGLFLRRRGHSYGLI